MLNIDKKRYGTQHDNFSADIYQAMSALAEKNHAINLSQGLPEGVFDSLMREKILENLSTHWQYTPTEGLSILRHAIACYHASYFDAEKEIIVTTGCTEALLSACMAARYLGHEQIILFEPFYSYYPGILRLAGCKPVICALKYDDCTFKINFSLLEQILQNGTQVLLLNIPHNPTGMVLNAAEWEHIDRLCKKYSATVILDNVYWEFQYEENFPHTIIKNMAERGQLLIASSISKVFAVTGCRIGWLAGSKKWVNLAHDAHIHMSNCLPALLQEAAAALFQEITSKQLNEIRLHYKNKMERLLRALNQYGFKCYTPAGGHFITANYKDQPSGQLSALDFCKLFTHHVGITPLPLDDFLTGGNSPWIRFSFAVDNKKIEEACNRLAQHC